MKNRLYIVFRFLIIFCMCFASPFCTAQKTLDHLNRKILDTMYVGRLTVAEKLNNRMMLLAEKNGNLKYINRGYINKINLNSFRRQFDSVFFYRKQILEYTLSPIDKMYYYGALSTYYSVENDIQLSKDFLKKASVPLKNIKDPNDLATWYNYKTYLILYGTEKKPEVGDSLRYYLSKWGKIVPLTTPTNQYKYYTRNISLEPFESIDLLRKNLNDLRIFTYKNPDDYYLFNYHLLNFLYYYPIGYRYTKKSYYDYRLGEYYLNRTELKLYDEFMMAVKIFYYRYHGEQRKIIALKDQLFEDNIATGLSDLALQIPLTYNFIGKKDSAYYTSVSTYHYLKKYSEKHDELIQKDLFDMMNAKNILLQEINVRQKTQQFFTFMAFTFILILITIVCISIIKSNQKLSKRNQELKKSNEKLENFVRIATQDLKSPIDEILKNVDLVKKMPSQLDTIEYNRSNRNQAEKSLKILDVLVACN